LSSRILERLDRIAAEAAPRRRMMPHWVLGAAAATALVVFGIYLRQLDRRAPASLASVAPIDTAVDWMNRAGNLPMDWGTQAQESLIVEAHRTMEDSQRLFSSMLQSVLPEAAANKVLDETRRVLRKPSPAL
jgi:hypothetical protein